MTNWNQGYMVNFLPACMLCVWWHLFKQVHMDIYELQAAVRKYECVQEASLVCLCNAALKLLSLSWIWTTCCVSCSRIPTGDKLLPSRVITPAQSSDCRWPSKMNIVQKSNFNCMISDGLILPVTTTHPEYRRQKWTGKECTCVSQVYSWTVVPSPTSLLKTVFSYNILIVIYCGIQSSKPWC